MSTETDVEYISKWTYLDAEVLPDKRRGGFKRVFEPHSGQLEFMEDDAQYLCATCGRRMGKSHAVAHEFIPEALITKEMATTLLEEGKRREFWTVGPNYSDAEKPFRVFWNKCRALGIPFDKPGTYFDIKGGDMTVSLWDGAFIYSAKSSAVPERLVGEGLAGVHMEEAAKQKEVVWKQMIMPSLMDFGGWAKFTTTPEGKNWYYDLHQKALRPSTLNWSAHRIPSWRNPHVYREPTVDAHVKRLMYLMAENPGLTSFEIIKDAGLIIDSGVAQMANDLTIPEFQQEIAAEFTDFVGKVFKEFDEESHVRELVFNPSQDWETVAAVDYGYRNPNVWLLIQIGPWGEINVVDELYQADLTPTEFANEILRRGLCPDSLHSFYADPASPEASRTLETIFRQHGKRARSRPHTGGDIDNRLNLIRFALKDRIVDTEMSAPQWFQAGQSQDVRRPRMMISTRCPKTIFEFGEYRYPKTKDEQTETSTKRYETPMKLNDHTPEALGRFLGGMYHAVAAQMGGGTRVTRGQFMRSLGRKATPGGYGETPAGIPTQRTPKRRGTWHGR
ncbi:terminase [Mycobacterium phage DrLupo]|uniref:Terminase n=1 Tax=Mycobacterium phage DrLupo TaxID=2499037 RepID=A0A3S9UQI8_9CAUD|nr:terminase [Mycobacterium phage DrLupo]AZS12542.1 terminase [Mycobacterium phage DrLupo]